MKRKIGPREIIGAGDPRLKHDNKFRAVWLPANQAYLVMFGDAACGIGPKGQRLYSSREELRAACAEIGLELRDDNSIGG